MALLDFAEPSAVLKAAIQLKVGPVDAADTAPFEEDPVELYGVSTSANASAAMLTS